MDLAIIIAIALLIFTVFIIVGTIKEYKEKDTEIERVSIDMENNTKTPIAEKNIVQEEKYLNEILDQVKSKDELEKKFIAIKEHLEEKINKFDRGSDYLPKAYTSILEKCRKKAAKLFDLFSLQEKYNALLEKQANSADDFKQEEEVLLNYIDQASNFNELDNYFDEAKRFIKTKLLKSSSFKNKEIREHYIKRYREMFASLKSSYENKLNNITKPNKSFYYDGIDDDENEIKMINTVKESDKDNKGWRSKVAYALLLFVLFFVFKGIFYAIKTNANEYSLEQDLKSIVVANTHLYPISIDSTVRAESITSNRNSLIFSYTITAYSAEQARRDIDLQIGLYYNTLNNSCKNAKDLLSLGANIVHVYYGNDNKQVKTFIVDKERCSAELDSF